VERLLFFWDDLDDAFATVRHVLRCAWQESRAAAPLKSLR
jgi:hypothetical protein